MLLALALAGGVAQALASEALPDPTRPPVEAGVETAGAAAVASGPVLQSVMIRPGRRTAVISGQLLAEGERFGGARLVRISEGEVVLAGPEGRQTLKLFPGVEKHFARPPLQETLQRGKNKSKRNSEQKAP
ncbi:MAG: MSHA biogenesis protein MshK [Nitrosomonadales bacterium]|nr:MAG: MSHA biogenesis protein MshK [Nitrosomonadales bacterium]